MLFYPQLDLGNNLALKRRNESDGEIHLDQAMFSSYKDIYNLVRGLNDPYPNAYISFEDGILYLQSVQKRVKLLSDSVILTVDTKGSTLGMERPLCIQTKDGYALITKSNFVSKA